MQNIEIMSYGKSMYGGWYADYFDTEKDEYDGVHADTLKGLCDKLGVKQKTLERTAWRFDN